MLVSIWIAAHSALLWLLCAFPQSLLRPYPLRRDACSHVCWNPGQWLLLPVLSVLGAMCLWYLIVLALEVLAIWVCLLVLRSLVWTLMVCLALV